jgi:hypothetical protein
MAKLIDFLNSFYRRLQPDWVLSTEYFILLLLYNYNKGEAAMNPLPFIHIRRLFWLAGVLFAVGKFSAAALPVKLAAPADSEEEVVFLPLTVYQPSIQAPRLKWAYGGCFSSWCQTGWYSSPAVANIDTDPQLEILAGSYDLVALDGLAGTEQWRAESDHRVWPGVAAVDLTGDGSLEIIVGRSGDQLSVYSSQGSLLWQRYPFGDGEIRTLGVADVDNDSEYEVIVGRASGGSTKQLSVYEPDGSVRPGWPARRDGEVGYGWGMYNQNAAAGDLDGDGYLEIIGPTDTHYITALDKDGNQLPAHSMYNDINPDGPKVWSQVGVHVDQWVDLRGYADCGVEHRPNFADSPPVIADLDGNGTPEIIVVGNVYNCGTSPYTSLYHMPFIFNPDRSRWAASGYDWTVLPAPDGAAAPISESYAVIETAAPNPVTADLDGDGRLEILYASYDGRVHAYWLDKTQHGNWPFAVYQPTEGLLCFASEPVVADLDNNGKAEVIFTSWVQKGTHRTGKLHILNYLGSLLHEIDLPAGRNGTWNGGLAAPTLANIDLDADLEIVLLTAYSGVVVYDLPGTSHARLLWSTGRGSLYRSGTP